MAKCKQCGKRGFFLKLNILNLRVNCKFKKFIKRSDHKIFKFLFNVRLGINLLIAYCLYFSSRVKSHLKRNSKKSYLNFQLIA